MYYELTINCIKAEKGLLKNLIAIINKIVKRVEHPHDAPPMEAKKKKKINVFVKPNDQNHACMSFGMARKRA